MGELDVTHDDGVQAGVLELRKGKLHTDCDTFVLTLAMGLILDLLSKLTGIWASLKLVQLCHG